MKELKTSNNPVELSWIEHILREHDIPYQIFDGHMSIMEGSLGILPRRVMVSEGDLSRAAYLLKTHAPDEN